jgi:hypothetical protein
MTGPYCSTVSVVWSMGPSLRSSPGLTTCVFAGLVQAQTDARGMIRPVPRLRAVACDLTLLLLVAAMAMWGRSYSYADTFDPRRTDNAALTLDSRRGGLTLAWGEFRTPMFAPADDVPRTRWHCEWLGRSTDARWFTAPWWRLGFGWATVAGTGWTLDVPYWAIAAGLACARAGTPSSGRSTRAVPHLPIRPPREPRPLPGVRHAAGQAIARGYRRQRSRAFERILDQNPFAGSRTRSLALRPSNVPTSTRPPPRGNS